MGDKKRRMKLGAQPVQPAPAVRLSDFDTPESIRLFETDAEAVGLWAAIVVLRSRLPADIQANPVTVSWLLASSLRRLGFAAKVVACRVSVDNERKDADSLEARRLLVNGDPNHALVWVEDNLRLVDVSIVHHPYVHERILEDRAIYDKVVVHPLKHRLHHLPEFSIMTTPRGELWLSWYPRTDVATPQPEPAAVPSIDAVALTLAAQTVELLRAVAAERDLRPLLRCLPKLRGLLQGTTLLPSPSDGFSEACEVLQGIPGGLTFSPPKRTVHIRFPERIAAPSDMPQLSDGKSVSAWPLLTTRSSTLRDTAPEAAPYAAVILALRLYPDVLSHVEPPVLAAAAMRQLGIPARTTFAALAIVRLASATVSYLGALHPDVTSAGRLAAHLVVLDEHTNWFVDLGAQCHPALRAVADDLLPVAGPLASCDLDTWQYETNGRELRYHRPAITPMINDRVARVLRRQETTVESFATHVAACAYELLRISGCLDRLASEAFPGIARIAAETDRAPVLVSGPGMPVVATTPEATWERIISSISCR